PPLNAVERLALKGILSEDSDMLADALKSKQGAGNRPAFNREMKHYLAAVTSALRNQPQRERHYLQGLATVADEAPWPGLAEGWTHTPDIFADEHARRADAQYRAELRRWIWRGPRKRDEVAYVGAYGAL